MRAIEVCIGIHTRAPPAPLPAHPRSFQTASVSAGGRAACPKHQTPRPEAQAGAWTRDTPGRGAKRVRYIKLHTQGDRLVLGQEVHLEGAQVKWVGLERPTVSKGSGWRRTNGHVWTHCFFSSNGRHVCSMRPCHKQHLGPARPPSPPRTWKKVRKRSNLRAARPSLK